MAVGKPRLSTAVCRFSMGPFVSAKPSCRGRVACRLPGPAGSGSCQAARRQRQCRQDSRFRHFYRQGSRFPCLDDKNDGKTSYCRPEQISGLLDDRNLQNPFLDDRNRRFLGGVIVRVLIFWALTTKTGKQMILTMIETLRLYLAQGDHRPGALAI